MVDQPKPLTKLDWDVIGSRGRRIQVPLPNDRSGIHSLAQRFYGLAEQLHSCARQPHVTDRSAIMEAAALIKHANLFFLNLQRDWEREWREALGLEIDGQEDQAHTENAEGTARVVNLRK